VTVFHTAAVTAEIEKPKRNKKKRSSKGNGTIQRIGNCWYLRFWDWRVIDGQQQRVRVRKKLCEVEAGYRSKKPPADVVQVADEFLAPEDRHKKADHPFERDGSLPQWHGWHGFRRGLATNLHDLGADE
jgi:hypothetical protein